MNQTQFAKHIGVSSPRVSKLIADGKLDGAFKIDEKTGLRNINAEKAVDFLDQIRDITSAPARDKLKKKVSSKSSKRGKASKATSKTSEEEKESVVLAAGTKGMTYATARTYNEQYKAALKKLEYEERKGQLVERDKVERDSFNIARQARDQCLAIADRCAPLVAVETDQFQCHEILIEEISRILNELSNAISSMCS